jgi:hypothetical protein
MNDIIINWKLMTSDMPLENPTANDKTFTLDEIIQILKYPDIRIKHIIFTMVSSGIRIGAWDYLRWKQVDPISLVRTIMTAKLVIYAEEPENYY